MGIAIADSELRIAQPLETLDRLNRNDDMRRLRELVRERSVKLIVVGLPLRLDGTHGEMAEEAERFAKRLTRAEIEKTMKETGLDQQMKLLDYWDAWQSGDRGRKP